MGRIWQRVAVIGLDGATLDLLRPIAAAGYMPRLAGLLAQGAAGPLTSSIPPITAAAWTSFATGMNPGKHGLVDFVYFPRRGYEVSVATSAQRQAPPFWQVLGQAGLKVGIVGVPMEYPPQPVNGFLLTGMMTPPGSTNIAYPPALAQELEQAVGGYLPYEGEGVLAADPKTYSERVCQDTARRAHAGAYLIRRYAPDFFAFVFMALDPIQHQFFHLLNLAETLTPAQMEQRAAILKVYRAVDEGIGELCDALGEDTLVIIMSDHGFGPLDGFLHLNNWLLQHGYLALKRDPETVLRAALFRAGMTPENVYRTLRSWGLDLRRKANRGQSYKRLRRYFLSFANVDWARTRAYALGHVGQIFINLQGRQPQGNVARGTEYEALVGQLSEELLALRTPGSGRPLIERVYRQAEVYRGRCLDDLPDLVLQPTDFRYVAFGESEFASNKIVAPTFGHTGHHRMNGTLIVAGPGVRAGALNGASLVDIAPTILHALGCAIPAEMDGTALTALFEEGTAGQRAIVIAAPAGQAEQESENPYSEQEEEEIRCRLENLGYIA
jgi:predicted AlkP superfamily phosphohydrolase/phosphomutase